MGKKIDKKDRYEHKDFSEFLDKPNARPAARNPQRPEPVVPEAAKTLCAFFQAQISQFIEDSNSGDIDASVVDSKLFRIDSQGTTIEGVPDCALYVLDRTIRRDRSSGELIRTSLSAVAIKDGAPAFYVSGYITSQLIGSLQVAPFGEHGPNYRNAAKWSNRV